MFAYDIGVLLLIKYLRAVYTYVNQSWYSEYTGAIVKFGSIELYFNHLKQSGLGRGYYPKPSKSVIIVHPDNLGAGK